MKDIFGNHYHAFFHLLLTLSLHKRSPRSFGPCDCSSYKQKMLVTYFCAFGYLNKIRKAIIYNSSMLGGLRPTHTSPTLGLGAKML